MTPISPRPPGRSSIPAREGLIPDAADLDDWKTRRKSGLAVWRTRGSTWRNRFALATPMLIRHARSSSGKRPRQPPRRRRTKKSRSRTGTPPQRPWRRWAATTRSCRRQGKATITDGPFAEAKEVVGGYWLIQARSKEEALEWASRCPDSNCRIEVRRGLRDGGLPARVISPGQAKVSPRPASSPSPSSPSRSWSPPPAGSRHACRSGR
jgi:hypothetical protein